MAEEPKQDMPKFEAVISEINPEALLADGLDGACVGYVTRHGQPAVLCYDVERVIAILVGRDGMTPDQAREFFEFNIEGAGVGEHGPVWLQIVDGREG